MLRAHRLEGFHFRRQYPVGLYVLDFACVRYRLAVELDGMSHVGAGAGDDRRTHWLLRQGWRVLRYTNDQVLDDRVLVAQSILTELQQTIAPADPPSLPPPVGEGRNRRLTAMGASTMGASTMGGSTMGASTGLSNDH